MRRCILGLLILTVLSGGACGRDIDLAASLRIDAVTTGWFDAGITDGKKKLVPAVSFTLKNASDQKLRVLQVSASFRREGAPDEWGTAYLTAAGSAGLAPGADTGALTLRSQLGYTGSDSGPEMLGNSFFVDARVNLFAKYGSGPWTPVGDYPITRQLIFR
jgi:hypothetical protein